MVFQVMFPAEPPDLERLAIVVMVLLGLAAADLAGLGSQLPALLVDVGVGPSGTLSSRLTLQWVCALPFPRGGIVAVPTVALAGSALVLAAFAAQSHVRRCSTMSHIRASRTVPSSRNISPIPWNDHPFQRVPSSNFLGPIPTPNLGPISNFDAKRVRYRIKSTHQPDGTNDRSQGRRNHMTARERGGRNGTPTAPSIDPRG